jgi:hypothetical protein
LVSPDVDAYCISDADIYLLWHMSAATSALADADYQFPVIAAGRIK